MNEEYGLMIIWHNALNKKKEILDDLKKRFIIKNKFLIKWDKDKFSVNLTRFYGENLPPNSFKEKHCGNGEFLLIILIDKNPMYNFRKTSKGKKYVNINFFDSKEMYRKWTGEHMIHATNDECEFKHDLMLLLGTNISDYEMSYQSSEKEIPINKNTIGMNGWESLERVFYTLNETINYTVLRNFQELPQKYQVGEHGDVDILTDNQYNMIKILNAKKDTHIKSRARYYIYVDSERVYLDIRFVGDNYYDINIEKIILSSRISFKDKLYIPNEKIYSYLLLYHALIHKKKISEDYNNFFEKQFNSTDTNKLKKILEEYMKINKYSYVEPTDISVYFNEKNANQKMSIKRKMYFKCYVFIRIARKVQNVIEKNKKTN